MPSLKLSNLGAHTRGSFEEHAHFGGSCPPLRKCPRKYKPKVTYLKYTKAWTYMHKCKHEHAPPHTSINFKHSHTRSCIRFTPHAPHTTHMPTHVLHMIDGHKIHALARCYLNGELKGRGRGWARIDVQFSLCGLIKIGLSLIFTAVVFGTATKE